MVKNRVAQGFGHDNRDPLGASAVWMTLFPEFGTKQRAAHGGRRKHLAAEGNLCSSCKPLIRNDLRLISTSAPARFPGVEQFALIGETLRRLRKEKGKTLEKLGEEAGLGRGQLSRIENGKQEATLGTLSKILGSQGVTRREFFRRYDLVESEALANELAGGKEPDESALAGRWPEEISEVLGKVESFVQTTFRGPKPVAQGAVEIGDVVVLFRVMPKNAPRVERVEEAQPDPDPPPAPPGRKRKR